MKDEKPEIKNVPPFSFERNEYGLLKHINYEFNNDGTINWRAMIKKEYLVLNKSRVKEIEKQYGKTFAEVEIEYKDGKLAIDDKFLLILLPGIKELAQLRGYESVGYAWEIQDGSITVSCMINWQPNYELGMNKHISFQALADAKESNTSPMGRAYLAAMAENRAFVRAVRNFLRIHIVGYDEVGASIPESNGNEDAAGPHKMLEDILKIKGKSFEELKNKLISIGYDKENPKINQWEKVADIPKEEVFEVIEKIKKPKADKK